MPWKNSSVIKNSFFSKCLLATLYISAQINKHRLVCHSAENLRVLLWLIWATITSAVYTGNLSLTIRTI